MQKLLRFFSALVLGVAAQFAVAADDSEYIGKVIVPGAGGTPIRVSGNTAELDALARTAFGAHGEYRLVASGGQYEIRFSAVSGNAVNVQVIKGGSVALNQNVTGTSLRNAFFRAGDVAVKATSGLKGFFASKLAFISNRTGKDEVYVGDLFMGEVKQLTRDNTHALTPRWSPDGTKLIYTSYFRNFPDIYLINLQNNDRTRFVGFQGTNSGARFSPNGQRVVMVLSGEGVPEIYVSPASGKPVTRLTRSDAVKSSPCFSPDGSRIVYASEPGPKLYIMSAGGGGGQIIGGGLATTYCAEPDWSVGDPNKIAYTFREPSGRFQIAVHDLGTAKSEKVSKAPYDGVEPCWLADGRHLIYTARAAGSRSLFILDTKNGKTVRIGNIAAEKASVLNP